jgi:hypothetical protein
VFIPFILHSKTTAALAEAKDGNNEKNQSTHFKDSHLWKSVPFVAKNIMPQIAQIDADKHFFRRL